MSTTDVSIGKVLRENKRREDHGVTDLQTSTTAGTSAGIHVIQQQNQAPFADTGLDLLVEATGPDGARATPRRPTGASPTDSRLEPQP